MNRAKATHPSALANRNISSESGPRIRPRGSRDNRWILLYYPRTTLLNGVGEFIIVGQGQNNNFVDDNNKNNSNRSRRGRLGQTKDGDRSKQGLRGIGHSDVVEGLCFLADIHIHTSQLNALGRKVLPTGSHQSYTPFGINKLILSSDKLVLPGIIQSVLLVLPTSKHRLEPPPR